MKIHVLHSRRAHAIPNGVPLSKSDHPVGKASDEYVFGHAELYLKPPLLVLHEWSSIGGLGSNWFVISYDPEREDWMSILMKLDELDPDELYGPIGRHGHDLIERHGRKMA
jgi:hypothetical protein